MVSKGIRRGETVSRIKFRCSNCTNVLKVRESHAGRHGSCPVCGQKVQIPTLEEYERRREKREARSKRCPECNRRIRREASTCHHCGWGQSPAVVSRELDALDALIDESEEPEAPPKKKGLFDFLRFSRGRSGGS
jgi:hypothetical protein